MKAKYKTRIRCIPSFVKKIKFLPVLKKFRKGLVSAGEMVSSYSIPLGIFVGVFVGFIILFLLFANTFGQFLSLSGEYIRELARNSLIIGILLYIVGSFAKKRLKILNKIFNPYICFAVALIFFFLLLGLKSTNNIYKNLDSLESQNWDIYGENITPTMLSPLQCSGAYSRGFTTSNSFKCSFNLTEEYKSKWIVPSALLFDNDKIKEDSNSILKQQEYPGGSDVYDIDFDNLTAGWKDFSIKVELLNIETNETAHANMDIKLKILTDEEYATEKERSRNQLYILVSLGIFGVLGAVKNIRDLIEGYNSK